MAVNDARRDVLLGREAELSRLQEAARSRRKNVKTILLTGPRGSGKTTLVQAAADGIGAEVLRLLGTPLGAERPFETGMNAIATFEQSETFRPIRGQIAQIVERAYVEQPTPVQLARSLVAVMRTLPPKDFPTVVLFEDLHLYDPASLQAVAFFARQNHLYDQTYLMTSVSDADLPDFEGLERLRLGPLPDQAAQACLSHWSEAVVPWSVSTTLNRWSDGVPLVLREVAATLDIEQLQGDRPLPLPPPTTPAVRDCLDPTLQELSGSELEALAVFAHGTALPAQVSRAAISSELEESLARRQLLLGDQRFVRARSSALGWAAWNELSPQARSGLAARLADGWSTTSPVQALYFDALTGPPTQDQFDKMRTVLGATPSSATPHEISERLAELCCTASPTVEAADGLRWLQSSLQAEHIGSALEALHVSIASAARDGHTVLELTRCRGVLADLTGTPRLALPASAELAEIAALPTDQAFVAWVTAARSAVRVGALQQGRRYLDQAHALSRSAHLAGRALWRLTDCEWHLLARRPVRPEVMMEALTSWCDHGGGQDWYDDAHAVTALVDLGAHDAARQFLLGAEAAHSDVRGTGQLCLLATRLHLELASLSVDAAILTAQEVSRRALSPRLRLPALHADLLLLAALTGRNLVAIPASWTTSATDSQTNAANGYQALIDGDHRRAGVLLQAALAARPPLSDGWETLADLTEAHFAAGEALTSAAAAAAELREPRSVPAAAAAARLHLLLAGPLDVQNAFTQALQRADQPLPLIYRARVMLTYARKLEQQGGGHEAAQYRRQASELFAHQRLPGWQRIAQQQAAQPNHPAPQLHDQLDLSEQQILRLLAAGRRNKEIAADLFVSLRTVEKILTGIYRKLGVTSKVELMTKLNLK